MSVLIFEKSGTPTVMLTDAPDLNSSSSIRPNQVIQRFWGGGYSVLTRRVEDDFINLIFGEMIKSEAEALEAFFKSDAVNFSASAFLYTDENSNQHQVRYIQSNLPGIPNGPNTRRVSITLAIDRGVLD